jgi:phytoene synthase
MPNTITLQSSDVQYCKLLNKKHGKSYYFATRFFPRELREATYVLYAFFRVPDELVDNPVDDNPAAIYTSLEAWRSKWRSAYMLGESDEPVLRATYAVFKHYNIPYQYSEDFLQAMLQDVTTDRYQTYQELEYYMYGSAAVVGLMMSYVIGYTDPRALEYAKQLGYAMQLTNFIRDIKEDAIDRYRIYMPKDELAQFNLHEVDILDGNMSEDMIAFLQFQIARARGLYEAAEAGIHLLHPRGQFAVRAASRLYGAILLKIEEAEYNVFAGRVRTSLFEKIHIVWTLYKK